MIIQNTSSRLPIKLISSTGSNATGILPSDIKNNSIQIIKNDGSTSLISLTVGVNWFEIDSTQSPGLYHVLIPAGSTNLLGNLQYSVYPSATAFVSFVGTTSVGLDIIQNIKGSDNRDLTAIAGTGFNSTTDSLHAIKGSLGGSNPWDSLVADHLLSGSFGEAIRLIKQATIGDQKLNTSTMRLQILGEDKFTVIKEFYLLDELGNPSINNIKSRIGV
jgi:hypothetical protein